MFDWLRGFKSAFFSKRSFGYIKNGTSLKPLKRFQNLHKCFDSYLYRTGQSGNLRTEPKFIVFLSKLLLLFNICPACKSEKPFVEISALGSMVEVTTRCHNPDLPSPRNTWQSQPQMTGTRMPAGNFLLCFSVLLSGASPSKVLQVFKNMGLSCISKIQLVVYQ